MLNSRGHPRGRAESKGSDSIDFPWDFFWLLTKTPRCTAIAKSAPTSHIYVQQGVQQGGYFDEIAVDPINLQPEDEEMLARRLQEELTRGR